MVLLKAFFRKKKTGIFIKLFSILVVILLLISNINEYVDNELDQLKMQTATLIMFALNEHDDLITIEGNVASYNRVLSMEPGVDNEVIYMPKKIDGTYTYVEKIDYTKINWERLLYNLDDYPYIFTFPDSYCNVSLSEDEIILALEEDIDYRKEYINNYINHEINFVKSEDVYTFNIKSIIDSKTFNYVCISHDLYNRLLVQEERFVYELNPINYKAREKLVQEWKELEKNDFYSIGIHNYYSDPEIVEKQESLEKLVFMFNIANVISIIIFLIVVLLVIKDLIEDEEESMLLLKQIGFNRWQNMWNTLKNMVVLNIIVFALSLVFSGVIAYILNSLFDLCLVLFNIEVLFYLIMFVTLVELLLIALFMKKY